MLNLRNTDKKYLRHAVHLKKMIEKLDKIIFPDKPAQVFIRKFSKRNFRAAYTHPSKYGGDYYTIFIDNLGSGINEREDDLIFEIRKNGKVIILPPEKFRTPPPQSVLMALACHEVRHRMQLRQKLKFLMQELPYKKRRSPILQESLKFVLFLFNNIRKESADKGIRGQYLAGLATDFREFDSVVLEIMVMHTYKPGNSLRKVLQLLKMGT